MAATRGPGPGWRVTRPRRAASLAPASGALGGRHPMLGARPDARRRATTSCRRRPRSRSCSRSTRRCTYFPRAGAGAAHRRREYEERRGRRDGVGVRPEPRSARASAMVSRSATPTAVELPSERRRRATRGSSTLVSPTRRPSKTRSPGKRDLRLKVARNALAAAKMSRVDAERTLVFQVKSAYAQVAQAALGVQVREGRRRVERHDAEEVPGSVPDRGHQRGGPRAHRDPEVRVRPGAHAGRPGAAAGTGRARLPIGVRGEVPDFDVDTKVLDFTRAERRCREADRDGLLRMAFDHRPTCSPRLPDDRRRRLQVALTKRQKFPDITLGANYAWGGFGGLSTNGPIGPGRPLTFGLSAPLPVFYQLQGELRQAEAQVDANGSSTRSRRRRS